MDAELEFAIQPNTTGKQLFDQVGLCEFASENCHLEKNVCSIRVILFVKHLPGFAACFSLWSRPFSLPSGFNCVNTPGLAHVHRPLRGGN